MYSIPKPVMPRHEASKCGNYMKLQRGCIADIFLIRIEHLPWNVPYALLPMYVIPSPENNSMRS